mmetsp:Transcript_10230/g.23024  ORF Transcript_10230/g.23024 Transcript_10230/m.23024 type:complete len:105 (+) Transcript_10230:107-421(+)
MSYVLANDTKSTLDKAYMSCSLQRSVGNFYARRHALLAEDLDDSVLLRIKVPAGTSVICPACAPGNVLGEEEVLLPRGSLLNIDRVYPRIGSTDIMVVEARLAS